MNARKAPIQSTTAPKVTKLRESCDSCLVAKVKCSKTRPVCSRCLANGATCGYSPSSRAGRKHRKAVATETARNAATYPKTKDIVDSAHPTPSSSSIRFMYPTDETEERSHVTAPLVGASAPDRPSPRSSMIPNRLLAAQRQKFESPHFFPVAPLGDNFGDLLQYSTQPCFPDPAAQLSSPRSSDNETPNHQLWGINESSYPAVAPFPVPIDIMPFDSSLSSPSSDGAFPPELVQKFGSSPQAFPYPCDCFAVCLQALQALHNNSFLPTSAEPCELPFDVVLTINREALKGCGAMLDCVKCVSKTGSSISTMLLGTIFGKIISLYGAACFFRFGQSSDSQAAVKLAFGAYTLTGEDRRLLEMEIILLELKKVESILTTYQERFRNADAETDESSVYNALTCYLDKNLRFVLDFLQSRRGGWWKQSGKPYGDMGGSFWPSNSKQ